MPRITSALTDVKVKNAKPSGKPFKLFDGGGLYLLVTQTGGKLWRIKYSFNGKEKLLSIGIYPTLSLSEARDKRHEAKKKIEAGIDPGEEKKSIEASRIATAENTFEKIARECFSKMADVWTTDTIRTNMGRLERDIFPVIGNRPIDDITVKDVLETLQRVESRGTIDSAHRCKTLCSKIFRFAVATDRVKHDITTNIQGALKPIARTHRAAILTSDEIAGLLRSIDGYQGTFIVKCALKLAPLLFVRPGELRHAEWVEIDFEKALWTIPAGKMKMKQSHIVPLSHQAIAILKELNLLTGNGGYVFPSFRSNDRPMSNNAVLSALRRMGYEKDEMSGHGFRAMARTILDEVLEIRPDFVEHQLAHAVRDPNGRAYNRTSHLTERAKMMQVWADYLDGLKTGSKVIPFRKKAA